jgi:hypothetical protein
MKYTPATAKIVSVVLGVLGALWLITLVASFTTLSLRESLLKLGCGLTFISLALEPAILFRPLTLETAKRPGRRSPVVRTLSLLGTACLLLAGAVWLAS